MSGLNRKLLRDLIRLRGHVTAIALVATCGVASFVALWEAYQGMVAARDAYYRDYRFADVFASARRAPIERAERIASLPGVATVEHRLSTVVMIEVRDFAEPAFARLSSLPDIGQARLNQLYLRAGRMLAPGRADEVIVGQAFADAHRLRPGDQLTAIINMRRQMLRIVGIANSPEYINEGFEYASVPDHKRFGVLWMGRGALEAALDMKGAFNSLTLTLSPAGDQRAVIEAVDRELDPFAGRGAIGREDHFSARFLEDEIKQDRITGTVVPAIFLSVAAFLIYNVLLRLVTMQRAQIAVLKAFGYGNLTIVAHFVKLAIAAVGVGALAGVALGVYFGDGLAAMYRDFFYLPRLEFGLSAQTLITVLAIVGLTGAAGAVPAVLRAVRVPPAAAMQPLPPASFRPTLIERIGPATLFAGRVPVTLRMILRQLERRPLRSVLSVLATACAAALIIIGRYSIDAIDEVVHQQYQVARREDIQLHFTEPRDRRALYDLAAIDGVTRAEPFRYIGVRLRHGHHVKRAAIEAGEPSAEMRRIVGLDRRQLLPPEGALILSSRLARALEVEVGDRVVVEVLEGRRLVRELPVVGLVDEYVGQVNYTAFAGIAALLGEAESISGVNLAVDRSRRDAVMQSLKQTPVTAAVGLREAAIESFYHTIARNMTIMTGMLIGFASAIAAGVVYNGTRISLSEHAVELATLRILGFTRREVGILLLGEQAILIAFATPLGCLLGYFISGWLTTLVGGENFQLPWVVGRQTYSYAVAVMLGSALVSAALVLRRLNRFDLVEALKARE